MVEISSHHILKIKNLHLFLVLWASTFLLFASCTHGEEPTDSPEANFQSLWTTIDQHYCFLDYKKQELGVDWNEVYQRYHGRISQKMNDQQLFEVLCEMLAELKDGHVNLYCSSDIGRNWSWHEDFPKNLDEEVREAYLGTGNDFRMASGLKYRILPNNIGYLVCESFNQGFGEGNLSEIMYYLKTCTGLIVDVRGNGGGSLMYADRLAARFTNERILVGYTQHKTGPGHNDFSEPVAKYIEPSKGVRWQKKCIVLTNRHCYSATNDFVCSMKQCANVQILGDQTGGGSGLPFMSELPNGWYLRYSSSPSYDAQMNQIEFGIQPDIRCDLKEEDVQRGKDTMIELAIEKLLE